jgi:hypothetical protein
MSQKLDRFELNDPIYERSISLYVGGTEQDLYAAVPSPKFNRSDEEVTEGPDINNDGCQFHIKEPDETFVVWISRRDPQLLHHELFHLTLDVLETVGLSLTPESEEAYAYWTAHIFADAYDRLFGLP